MKSTVLPDISDLLSRMQHHLLHAIRAIFEFARLSNPLPLLGGFRVFPFTINGKDSPAFTNCYFLRKQTFKKFSKVLI